MPVDAEAALSAGIAILVYVNTFGSNFVYDDSRAIVKNLDIRPTTSITNLLYHDYWGTPMTHSGSHKSYRPVTTLTFRVNFALSKLEPWSYHLFNVLLHSLATWLFVMFVKRRVFHNQKNNMEMSICAGIYFAVHPIHTEAVAGVVGRADILSAIFVFAALLCYSSYCDHLESYRAPHNETLVLDDESRKSSEEMLSRGNISRKKWKKKCAKKSDPKLKNTGNQTTRGSFDSRDSVCSANSNQMKLLTSEVIGNQRSRDFVLGGLTILFAVLAIFSKETGFAALPLCIGYDLWMRSRLGFVSILKVLFLEVEVPYYRCLRKRIWRLILSTMIVMAIRILPHTLLASGPGAAPSFSAADNPASSNDSLFTRCLTFNYLILCNTVLIIFPMTLSYDWGEIDLVESIADPRTLYTAAYYAIIVIGLHKLWKTLRRRDSHFKLNTAISTITIWSYRNHKISQEDFVDELEYPRCRKSCNKIEHISDNITPTTFKDKKQDPINTVTDEGISFDTPEQICPADHHEYPGDISLSQFMLDHVKSNSKTHSERAESIQSSGYATDSSDERRVDELPQSQNFRNHSQQCTTSAKSHGDTKYRSNSVDIPIMGLSFLVIPFLPATNILFYVGFVIAERILYLPTAGFCILIAFGWRRGVEFLDKHRTIRLFRGRIHKISLFLTLFALVSLAARTMHRNTDWKDEYHLYRSGISTSPAKSWSNLGNVMKESGRINAAESCYRNALSVRGNMADVHYNLGLLYQEQDRHIEALERYRLAIRFRKTLAVAYLNTGVVLSDLGRAGEAEKMYRITVALDDTGLRDPLSHARAKISALYNLGCLLSSQNRHEEAIVVFQDAVERLTPDYEPESLYNMLGQSLHKRGRKSEAEMWFKSSLSSKPDHIPAHLTYAFLLRDSGRTTEAKQLYENAIRLNSNDHIAYNHYAKFLIYEEDLVEASNVIIRAYQTNTGKKDYETVMLAGDIFRLLENYSRAEQFYRLATYLQPEAETAVINLGATLHLQDKYTAAKSCYHTALQLNPKSKNALKNLRKLENLMKK